LPEIRRVDLCGTVLALHAWGQSEARKFNWYEAPPEETLVSAERLLALLGALNSETNGKITPLGRKLMTLPVHPRLGRLMIAAGEEGMLSTGAAMAALLSEKDIAAPSKEHPRDRHAKLRGSSDLLVRLEMLEYAEKRRFAANLWEEGIDPNAARQVARVRDELLRSVGFAVRTNERHGSHSEPYNEEVLLKLLLLAYPDRVARRRGSDPSAAVAVGGGGLRLAKESVVQDAEFFLALDARHDQRNIRSEALVKIASAIEEKWLEELYPQFIRRQRVLEYDPQRQRVVARGTVSFFDLVLREEKDAPVDSVAAGPILADALRKQAMEIFQNDPAASAFLSRLALLRKAMPEQDWPTMDEQQLGQILADACLNKRSLAEITSPGLATLLRNQLLYPLDRLFEQHAPEALEVPSGSWIKLDYSGPAPVLAVRLQELFGWTDTPRIAGGRIPVVLHLLGPNYRPVQITEDLRNFWKTTYFQVRKDLRARYPKHSWPEDPLTAKPEAKGRRKR
jgi:ATP-dependent helicase HrpB